MSESWEGCRLVPEDVLFFRDGRPSSMGDDHYLRSIFPPYPSTLYGLVRTQRLLEEGCDLTHVSEAWWKSLDESLRVEIGEWNGHGSLKLRGPWLVREVPGRNSADYEILVPAPHDLRVIAVTDMTGDCRKVTDVVRLLPESAREGRCWSHGLAPMTLCAYERDRWTDWHPSKDDKEPEPAQGWFIRMSGIERWMAGQAPMANDFVDSRTLWKVETRTGVGLQKDRRMSMDRMLYTFGFIRLNRGISIGFELTGGKLQADCHVRLGGENRLALLESGPSLTAQIGVQAHSGTNDSAFALITPGIFDKGSVPNADVKAAVVSETVRAGGWDLAERRPKQLWRAVPAGSVYYIDGGPAEQLSSLSKQASEGFGLTLRGNRPRR